MADKLEFELVSPEKLLVSQPVAMVVVPGADGLFGVLPGHAPMIVTVRPGIIDVYGDNQTTVSRRIFVAGGFAEVTDTRCTVLAEEASDLDALLKSDTAALEKQISDLREDIEDATSDVERRALETRLVTTQAKLDLIASQQDAEAA
ncbi:ATP synthase F1 subunit epsilon [Rhodospirillum centenum]|uniref:ATP synthase epsilon chain n=1 Tax=Rhodospirillum centenum (strain ATCC 51521 / SW) TaxID=414684 RepID=ATPE_RHOCS|nr:ATP synthase F1 subunit epsilon [Rhodospirillum centenum]B6IPC5.1 RecName: Full=ATP synthase epsilon chain; AltName: Full=ATP synthase F1 sector epsilon subunit; AltName: Full=F-ATPase epsilon subunit [Rhodospirillum centenum SW]ACI99627.1 ATP synthase F1, epsilon subunit [Rhodospirillum centenum SW]